MGFSAPRVVAVRAVIRLDITTRMAPRTHDTKGVSWLPARRCTFRKEPRTSISEVGATCYLLLLGYGKRGPAVREESNDIAPESGPKGS